MPASRGLTLTVWLPASRSQAATDSSGPIGSARSSLTVQRRFVRPAAIAGVRCRCSRSSRWVIPERGYKALYKHHQLDGLEADNGEYVWACSTSLIGQNVVMPICGEWEWFGEFRVNIHFFSQEPYPVERM